MRDTGWTLEDEAAAGAIGGHAGTHVGLRLASGDTLGSHPDEAVEELEESGAGRDESEEPAAAATEREAVAAR